jgi:hypothetical protein
MVWAIQKLRKEEGMLRIFSAGRKRNRGRKQRWLKGGKEKIY